MSATPDNAQTQTQAHSPGAVPTRRMSFEESLRDVPRHFTSDGDLITSHLTAALSSVFPDGEDFFVRTVRHYRNEVTDPELKRQVAGFIGQESIHGREHRAFNDRLAELGYPTKRYERLARRVLAFRERLLSAESNLAVTVALEHFTATMAEMVLGDNEFHDLAGHAAVAELFAWHALEEAEHKAVAFDVYRAVGGSERTRVFTMKVVRVGFVLAMIVLTVGSMVTDRDTWKPGVLRQSWRRFKDTMFLDSNLRQRIRDYDRPDFHPNDWDTTELIERWREEFFGENGTLNDRLVGSASAAA